MENKYLSRVAMVFIAILLVCFGYLYAKQTFFPGSKIPTPVMNTNTSTGNSNGTENILASTGASPIKKFATAEEFANFIAEHASSGGYSGMNGIAKRSITGSAPASAQPGVGIDFPQEFAGFSDQSITSNELGGGGDYSQTNIQVQGVDEADIVKTDGKYVYALSQNNLFLIDAYPATGATILSKIEFKSQPQNMFINGDSLIVFGYDTQFYQTELYRRMIPRSQVTFFKIFDVSDRKNPKQLRDLDIEGSYLNSRMIGDYVYLLTSKYSYDVLDEPMPLPRIIEGGDKVLNDPTAAGVAFPNVYYFDIPYDGYSLTSVHAINTKDTGANIATDTYVVDPSQQIYVSEQALYLTYTKRLSEEVLAYEVVKDMLLPKLPAKDQSRIAEIEKVPNYILNQQEKFYKITVIIERYQQTLSQEERNSLEKELTERIKTRYAEIQKQLERTIIHKIAIDKGQLTYQGFGDVPGYVLNQYSMDESDGYFRIATTKSRTWTQFDTGGQANSYSNVYVLDGSLKTVGSLEQLATGEQIYAVRFMGKRAYLVTYQQTDPFFAIDLSDPKNPKVLGELKIPGFSNYLHPYDDTTIIGLGKDTEQNQYGGTVQKGVKISLFDVADVSKPKEVAKYTVDDPSSNSLALTDPKAFLFSKDKNLLVIPINTYGSTGPMPLEGSVKGIVPPRKYFNGAYVFTIKKDSIQLKGTIQHSETQKSDPYGDQYYDPQVKRSLYIQDTLYTVSDLILKANKLVDLSEVKTLELVKNGTDDFKVVN